ncbi:hypothetical protein [Actinotalea sp. C106]|uniref:hypothetical protein n=1 Tax=Actinotalea sp. C106 TaxID=2908644 RepID=UPI00202837C0|nr:hypothetical protein [Actinotalea sp. C106]
MDEARRPWHLWLVGFLALALYVMGARDYLLSAALDADYFAAQGYDDGGVAYFTDYPVAPRILWTLNVVAGLLAPVLLMLRSRWATPTAAVAAGAQVVLLVVTFAFMDRWAALGAGIAGFDIGIAVLTVGLWAYCRWMAARGVLR